MATNHAARLGKLIGNFQSLESLLRTFLDKASPSPRLPHGKTYFGLQPGETVPVNAFTNFDTLGQLVGKFNAAIAAKDSTLQIDASIVAVRDILAHGRVAAVSPDETQLKIIKFDRPQNGSVRVMECAMMTDQWLDVRIALVDEQIDKVARALK